MRFLLAVIVTGCFSSPDYDGTMYRCVQHPDCPPGFTCESGVCIPPHMGSGSDDLMTVPAGTSTMGCPASYSNCASESTPAHAVTLSAFVIERGEVTQHDYATCVSLHGCTPPAMDYTPDVTPDLPVRAVTWTQATTYCQNAVGLALPTEAQWERAARGTDDDPYPWGTGIDCTHADYAECSVGAPVAETANPAGDTATGLHHMAGNVREWIADWWQGDYAGAGTTDPTGPSSGSIRVARGGGYDDSQAPLQDLLLVWGRVGVDPAHADADIGFRCARTMP